MPPTSTPSGSRRLGVVAALMPLIASLVACAAPAPASRPVVPPPRLELQPVSLRLLPGGEARLLARPRGGEAMLFHVDWQIVEGASGGRLEAGEARADDGRYAARYIAPDAEGIYHVVARLREYPAAAARVEIRVRR